MTETKLSTSAIYDLSKIATDDEIEAVRRVLADAQRQPTEQAAWYLRLAGWLIERGKARGGRG